MNKTELTEEIANKSGSTHREAAAFLNAFVEITEETLKKGDSVVIPGFGSFVVTERAARMARDFKSGKNVQVPASRCVRFKVGKTLKESVKQ